MKSFGLALINKLNKNSTNAKTQIDYCFANVNGWKCDYFESLRSFHKPLWIRKHEIVSQFHVDENEQIRTDMHLNLGDLSIDDRSNWMDIDDQSSFEQTHTDISFNIKDFHTDDQPEIMEIVEQSFFENYEMADEEKDQIHTDISFNLKELKTDGLRASTIFNEKSPIETYEIVDLNTRRILDHFLLVLDSNNTTDTDHISNQARIINDLIEKSPFITVHNKDLSVRLKPKTEYSVQELDSVYARTRSTGDGNCLYSSLSIMNIGSEKLMHSMRLLAVNAVINKQLKRTAMDTIWGGEVQTQALSIALFHPIYSYIQFNSDPQNRHYISSSIELQELVDRFVKGTAGGHLKYIGYKSDMNKLGFCLYYSGILYDALLPFQDNPQQFLPHFDLINMSL
ncbi:unnamed protein product [Rotaria socialis]